MSNAENNDSYKYIDEKARTTVLNNDINNNNNEKFRLRRKMQKQTQRRRSLHFGRTHDQSLEECYRGICSC